MFVFLKNRNLQSGVVFKLFSILCYDKKVFGIFVDGSGNLKNGKNQLTCEGMFLLIVVPGQTPNVADVVRAIVGVLQLLPRDVERLLILGVVRLDVSTASTVWTVASTGALGIIVIELKIALDASAEKRGKTKPDVILHLDMLRAG